MGKEKFVYNKHTLRYEKVSYNLEQKIVRTLAVAGGILAYSLVLLFLTPGKNSFMQDKDLATVQNNLNEMNEQLALMSSALDNIHDRDQSIYRQVLEMEPQDDGIWLGGKGGNDKYSHLRNLSEAELLIQTKQKISKLRQKIAMSVESQDEILKQVKDKEKMLGRIPSIRPIAKLDRKLEHLSGFGYRVHPVHKIRKMHTGIDFGAKRGTPIYATGAGKIARVEYKKSGYGRNVIIDHGYGYKSLYAHMSKVKVKVGQKVTKGEVIGLVGNTGTSTAPHVHYEISHKGKKINPLPFCSDGMNTKEYKEFVEAASKENQALSIE